MVHGSEAVTNNRLRRTIYYEFRPAEHIIAEGPWTSDWVENRMRLVTLALAQHARQHPDDAGFAWTPDDRFRPEVGDGDGAELRIAHKVHSRGSYCSAGSVAV